MSQDIQAGVYDSVRSLFRRKPKHPLAVGAPCPNCGTTLTGPWCHACGQAAEDFHRSFSKLAAEALEGLFDTDSRVWRTLPDLVRNPGRLTRRYLEGHRAAQAPPFRMFLISVVVVFLVAGLGSGMTTQIGLNQGDSATVNMRLKPTATTTIAANLAFDDMSHDAVGRWLLVRLRKAAAHTDVLQADLGQWAEHLAFLALPVSALLMGLMFVRRKGVYMFDHLIFSMHSLTFQGMLLALVMLLDRLTGWANLLLLAAPVHLFAHIRGTYRVGIIGALARMAALFVALVVTFVAVGFLLVFITLYEIGT